jgi:hypothetical protein
MKIDAKKVANMSRKMLWNPLMHLKISKTAKPAQIQLKHFLKTHVLT